MLPSGEWTIAFVFLSSGNSFFGKSICSKYWPPLSSLHRIKCLGEICKQESSQEIFLHVFLRWLAEWTESEKETVLIFSKNFLNFRLDTIEKQSYKRGSYTSIVLSDSEVAFLGMGRMQSFFQLSIVFWSYTRYINEEVWYIYIYIYICVCVCVCVCV